MTGTCVRRGQDSCWVVRRLTPPSPPVVTSLGGEHRIGQEDRSLSIGNASITETDIITTNGVIHIVDKLLSPYQESALALTVEKVLLASNASHFVEL